MNSPIEAAQSRFAQRLKELRQEHGLSLRKLARLAHYSRTYLWEMETGQRNPHERLGSALDRVFGTGDELSVLAAQCPPALPRRRPARAPIMPDLRALATYRQTLEDTARLARLHISSVNTPPRDTAIDGSASDRALVTRAAGEWARTVSRLYDLFVRRRPLLARIAPYRYSRRLRAESGVSPFRIEVGVQGRIPTTACSDIRRLRAPADVAARLRLDPHDDEVLCRTNHYSADDEPVQVGTTYLPLALALAQRSAFPTESKLGPGSLYEQLERAGHRLARVREEVSARLPTPQEAAEVGAPVGVPILEVLHTSYDADDQPFEVTRFLIRSDLSMLDYQLPVGDRN
ncbi:helix-turn-helix protein [Micromonospora pisi]|uniref:Helix-turn-helix protein n=1 Tax=Micromonospora pisi TaxID=589240 RepID=A0A495JVQ9_9ACTN|nr:UTRA domain-containing protein [Micromonospora pisi]RKR92354.1 helix-turn-helix protein [Micromonospora pisi]